MGEAMKVKVEGIKAEIARLSTKIARRIEELENETIDNPAITYHNDTSIDEAMERIRNLYHKGREICKRYKLIDGVCSEFKYEPSIFTELNLFEACARARAYLKKTCCGD